MILKKLFQKNSYFKIIETLCVQIFTLKDGVTVVRNIKIMK